MKLKPLIYTALLTISAPNSIADILSEPVSVSKGTGNVYRRNRSLGESDLMNLSSVDCREDLWLFIANRWYDVGRDEVIDGVAQDTSVIENILSNTTGPVTEYHNHPHEWCPATDGDHISLEPVSTFDVIAHACLFNRVRAHNGRRLISRVVDEHGVWTYSVTDRVRAEIVKNNVEVIEDLASVLYENSRNLKYEDSRNLNYVPRADLSRRLDSYIRRAREKGVIVSYRRMRE